MNTQQFVFFSTVTLGTLLSGNCSRTSGCLPHAWHQRSRYGTFWLTALVSPPRFSPSKLECFSTPHEMTSCGDYRTPKRTHDVIITSLLRHVSTGTQPSTSTQCSARTVHHWLISTAEIHHDITWQHFLCYRSFVRGIYRWPVNSRHICQWRGALIFSLICAWIHGWVNNREAGDLRRHRAHYNVTVMLMTVKQCRWFSWCLLLF